MDYIPGRRIRAALRGWKDLPALSADLRRESIRRSMYFHFRPGVKRYIPMALQPWVVTEIQRRTLRSLCVTIEGAARRLLAVRETNPEIRSLTPFTEGEERWLRDAYGNTWKRPETLFSRLDVSTDLGQPDWKERIRFLEANLVGIGATYYCWCSGQIAREHFAPRLEKELGRRLEPESDILEMILRRCRAHGRRIGRPDPTVAFVETKRVEQGPFEYQTMEKIYRDRGHRVVVADPIELTVRGGEMYYGAERVDLLYRDPTLLDLVEMEAEGDDLRAVRFAFRENRVVSSLAGEMDHKSIFELFSSDRYRSLFTPGERAIFRGHVPWTRLLRETRTEDPKGRDVELLPYVRRNRTKLVIKPNRDYGGAGVALGDVCTPAEWDRAVEGGMALPGGAVAQERIRFRPELYPILREKRVRWEPRYIVTGVHAGADESVILARMSEEPIVNITRGGAIVGVLVAR